MNALFLSLGALAATFQCCGFLLSLLMMQSLRQRQLTVQATQQYNAAVARLRHIRTRINRRRGRMWRNSGRTEQWWLNLFNGILPERKWKKNLRMNRTVFTSVVDELRPFLQPGRSPRGLDVLPVEKQLAMTLYFLKDQGSLMMTANAFGVANCTVSSVVRKVCDIITDVLGTRYIKLPNTIHKLNELVNGMENKCGFPQAFGCVDGTHIPIVQPSENPHDYFSYKLTYTLNVQGVCD